MLFRSFGMPADDAVLPDERRHLAFARAGSVRRAPHGSDRPVDVYDATAVLGALAAELRIAGLELVPARSAGLHPGRSAQVVVDGMVVGRIGEVASAVRAGLGVTGALVVGEVDLGALVVARRTERRMRPVSRFPASTIDLAFVVADDVAAGSLEIGRAHV